MVQEKKSVGRCGSEKEEITFYPFWILVVLLIMYFGLQAWNERREQQAEEEEKASEVRVTDIDCGCNRSYLLRCGKRGDVLCKGRGYVVRCF